MYLRWFNREIRQAPWSRDLTNGKVQQQTVIALLSKEAFSAKTTAPIKQIQKTLSSQSLFDQPKHIRK
ncbi:hypothetical protein GCM10007874_22150 [Labrys miyagiensis]|uniref:Uncharacterized protein n=1 Tax=Labrys miyagiensis TaxID=346912 RepID=A0ABQ6CFZ0_9HYPH|nr:hypothetical protein GCM10007874_22150 [Labrys miyagiensis]